MFTLQTLLACDEPFGDGVGKVAGFSLHAGVSARADERRKLEHLYVANSYSSCYRELINSTAVSLPTEFIQFDRQFGHDASNFSRRITAK